MPHRKGPSPRALVHPNREALRALRDRYMRQMEARSYDEVRNKFLEELHSKCSSDVRERSPVSLQRERGAGIWNKAFASAANGKMLRSSIILLAEFFDVEPEELILEAEEAPRQPHPHLDFLKHSPSRHTPRRGPTAVQSLSIGSISSGGGVHIQGSTSHTLIIHRGFISNIAIGPSSPEKASSRAPILLLAVEPMKSETTHHRLAEEMRVIRYALRHSGPSARFSVRRRTATRPEDFGQALLSARPRIVHLSGSGDQQGLFLQDRDGTARQVGPDALATVFSALRGAVECVVLRGCYAEPQGRAIFQHVPYVIGMKQEAGFESNLAFTKSFYQSLGEGIPVDQAFLLAVARSRRAGHGEHAMPVLLKQQ